MKATHTPGSNPESYQRENGLRDKLLSLFGFGNYGQEARDSELDSLQPMLKEMHAADAHQKEIIIDALSSHSGISARLNELADPDLDIDESLDIISQLNEDYGFPADLRHGKTYEASISLPRGAKLRIKLFPELGNALSFSISCTV